MRCVVITPQGTVASKDMTFEECRRAVGGDAELIRLAAGVWAYVNEDGKALGLPENRPATYLCHMVGANIGVFDFIVGPMVLVGPTGQQDLPEAGFRQAHELAARLAKSPRPATPPVAPTPPETFPEVEAGLARRVTVARLVELAGAFNEEIRQYTDDGDGYEYLRGQVELILDAMGVPQEDAYKLQVRELVARASDQFYRRA